MTDDAVRRLDALLQIALRVAQTARSGRVLLAQLADSLDPAWVPRPAGDELLALLEESRATALEPLPVRQVERILRDAWGGRPTDELDELEPEPLAVTPGAQVHRGVRDGAAVAVKVLRPGLAASARQDLRLLETVALPLGTAFPGIDVGGVLGEVRERVLEELDLESEAGLMRRFHRALRGHSWLLVPAPMTELCREQVLVSELIVGTSVTGPDDAVRLLVFVLGAARWGVAYADPHERNAIVTDDGRLAIVDFGACRAVDSARVDTARELLDALVRSDEKAFGAGLETLGWLGAADGPAALRLTRELGGTHLDPGPTRLDATAVIAARDRLARMAPEFAGLLARGRIQPEELWPARGVAQVLGTIARLGASGDWTAIALRTLRQGWDWDPARPDPARA